MISDLHSYLGYLKSKGRLVTIDNEVCPELEIAAFTDKANREKKYESKTLLFSNVRDSEMPVVTNLFGSSSTLKELFGNFDINEFAGSIWSNEKSIPILKGAKALLNSKPKISNFSAHAYKEIKSLEDLPVLKNWPLDAGRFITFPMVVTESSKSKAINVGVYRMQVFDELTTGMHWQAQKGGNLHAYEARKEGKNLNVSVAIGSDPFNMIAAATPLPNGINEFSFSGIIRGAKTILASNGKYPPVPANSEIVIFGYVDPEEKRIEGPFGDHTGYYSIPEPANVLHVEHIYAKKNATYAASIVGFPWHEDAVIGQFMLEYLKPMIKLVNDSIIDIYLPPEGLFSHMCIITVKKRFPGEAKKAMFSVLGLGQLSFTKIIIAFDDDINIRDLSNVMWALSSRVEPQRDIQIISGTPTDTLDHTANLAAYGSKVLIDATKKTKEEGYAREWPETISFSKDVMDMVDRKWKNIKY